MEPTIADCDELVAWAEAVCHELEAGGITPGGDVCLARERLRKGQVAGRLVIEFWQGPRKFIIAPILMATNSRWNQQLGSSAPRQQ